MVLQKKVPPPITPAKTPDVEYIQDGAPTKAKAVRVCLAIPLMLYPPKPKLFKLNSQVDHNVLWLSCSIILQPEPPSAPTPDTPKAPTVKIEKIRVDSTGK